MDLKELNFTEEEINELKRMANALIKDRITCRCYGNEDVEHKKLNDKYLEMDYEILKKIIMLENKLNEE